MYYICINVCINVIYITQREREREREREGKLCKERQYKVYVYMYANLRLLNLLQILQIDSKMEGTQVPSMFASTNIPYFNACRDISMYANE